MANNTIDNTEYLTPEGLRELEKRLHTLRTVRRPEVAKRLHNALQEGGEPGDDAEYEDAKNEQAFIEGEINRLEEVLRHAKIIEHTGPRDVVEPGCRVTLKEKGEDTEEVYYITGEAQADPLQGKISHKSPLGQALLGHKVKDKVKVKAPDGELTFVILAIE